MDAEKLKQIIEKHELWTEGEPEGQRAILREANLSGADLSGADLREAILSGAILREADLRRAILSGAILRGAILRGTCLDPSLHKLQREFCRQCPPLRTGGRIVYRTATSQHVGDTEYIPGHTYVAPVLSFSAETDCHPGIYAASLEWMRWAYPAARIVACYVRDGDWVISAKGAIRCKRLRVLHYVE